MPTTPAYGFQTAIGIDTANPVTKRFDFQSENLILSEDFKDTNGLRGTRSRAGERIVAGIRHVAGQITLQPNSLELANLLQWIMGGTPTGTPAVTYPLADALQTRFVTVDRVAKVFTYNGCVVDKCHIKGSQGEPLVITLDVCGLDETIAAAGSFPVIALDTTTQPFMFFELAITIGGVTYQAKDVDITIDNAIDKDRFFNSLTATALIAMDRHITVSFSLPYGDATTVYGLGAAGTAVVATFTNGGAVLTLTMGRVAFPRHSPSVAGRQEVMLPFSGTAYKNGSTLELVTLLNPGP